MGVHVCTHQGSARVWAVGVQRNLNGNLITLINYV